MSASQGKRPQCVEPLAQRPIGKIVVAAAAGSSSNCSYAQALTKAVATRGPAMWSLNVCSAAAVPVKANDRRTGRFLQSLDGPMEGMGLCVRLPRI